MRAVVVRNYGGPEKLELLDFATPEPGAGEVRIKVAAAAVNPVDLETRAGAFAAVIGERDTLGLGWDIAGTIDAVGPGVTGFAAGAQVVALLDKIAVDTGAYAEYVVLDAAAAAPAPRGADPAAASTFPLNALTAEQALDLVDLAPGATLLVTGGAGGLGGFTINLARQRGLRVVTTASAADETAVREFGAELFVPRTADLGAAVRALVPGGVDGAIDPATIGVAALDAVRDGGKFVAVTDPHTPATARGITVATQHVHHDGARLATLSEAVVAGTLPLRVADTFPLAEAAQAHQLLEKGGVRGRIVLLP